MTIQSPRELGFPAKFDRWRPPQLDALRRLLSSTKRVKALTAPTGFGKTAVYMAYALITKIPTCFVTSSRALQDQLMEDFRGCGLVDLRGRRNYVCDMRPDTTCEEGYAARCPYKGTVSCPSTQAEMRAACSPLVVTNYTKWTSARKFGQGMEHFQQVVFDEGHEAPHALADSVQVILNRHEIEDTLGLDFPDASQAEDFVNWKPWAILARAKADEALHAAKSAMQNYPDKPSYVRHYLHMRNLTRRLVSVASGNPNNWIADTWEEQRGKATHTGYVFDPIRPGKFAEAALLLRVPSILVVSATLRPKTLYMMGVSKEAHDYYEYASDFDPKRCPIYYVPTMRVDNKAQDFGALWVKHDQIAARRRDRKGIVHTVSYARQQEARVASRYADWMLLNYKGEAAGEMVNAYKQSGPGTILVSPSVGAGYDFPGKDCEWQLLLKIPFPNGHTKIHRARQQDDPEYGAYLAMNKMVQTFGRGMRSKHDQCENFIVDSHLDWFLPRFGHLAPKWFHGFFKQVSVLPAPPPKL